MVVLRGALPYRTEQGQLELRDLLKLGGVILLPMALIAKEPDLGTALTYIPILAVGVFLAGMPWKYWVAIGVVALVRPAHRICFVAGLPEGAYRELPRSGTRSRRAPVIS